MSDDLIDRLRNFTEDDAYATPWTFGEVVREAAAELARLRAEVERLRAALADERAHADALAEALERATVYVEGPMADRIGPMVRQCRAILDQRRARRQG
ncbi:hypothetical protein E3U26_04150 [Paracoccus ferrooxidans]|nr:hypothetical protein E3U26_04150 [Paracoccus ferrooxidans]